MSKKIIIPVLLSILLFNCVSVPVFADTTNNTNHVLSDADFCKEPVVGYFTCDKNEINNSYYEFVELDVSYIWRGEWCSEIGISSNVRDNSSFDFDYAPYIACIMDNLPKVGKKGERIEFEPIYMYIGQGICKEKLIKTICQLQNKINSNHEN